MEKQNTEHRGKTVLCALFVMLLWGSLFPMVKTGYEVFSIEGTASILLFAGLRFTLCGAFISLFSFRRHREHFAVLKRKETWKYVIGMALYAIILHYAFTYIGLSLSSSAETAILKQIGALLYVLLSPLLIKEERFTSAMIAGGLLGFAGILAMNYDGNGFSFGLGDACILAASFCTVISNVVGKRAFRTADPVMMTGVSQFFGGIVLLAAGIIGGGSMEATGVGSLPALLYILAASSVSYCLWYRIVQKGNLSRLFIIKFAEPVFAALFGALLLGETLWKIEYLASFLLIAAGILVSHRRTAK